MAKRRKLSQFTSEEQARRVQEEFAPIVRLFVERASQFLDDAGKEHGRIVALAKAAKGR